MKKPCRQAWGFTLVELAVVLVIVSLLLGGVLVTLAAQDNLRRTREAQQGLAEAREALVGFALTYGRLPRPAPAANDGQERAGDCSDDQECTGFLPWQTLGLAKSDPWGKLLRYSVTPAFASSGTPLTLATSASKKIRTRDETGALVYLAGNSSAPGSPCPPCVPAVIFSHGRHNWGTGENGNSMADSSATNIDEDGNQTGGGSGTEFVSRSPTDNLTAPGGEFDDQVVWLPATILFSRLIAAGKLP